MSLSSIIYFTSSPIICSTKPFQSDYNLVFYARILLVIQLHYQMVLTQFRIFYLQIITYHNYCQESFDKIDGAHHTSNTRGYRAQYIASYQVLNDVTFLLGFLQITYQVHQDFGICPESILKWKSYKAFKLIDQKESKDRNWK